MPAYAIVGGHLPSFGIPNIHPVIRLRFCNVVNLIIFRATYPPRIAMRGDRKFAGLARPVTCPMKVQRNAGERMRLETTAHAGQCELATARAAWRNVYLRAENLNTVTSCIGFVGVISVDGKLGWFGESGKC